jgi:hypothetical protein
MNTTVNVGCGSFFIAGVQPPVTVVWDGKIEWPKPENPLLQYVNHIANTDFVIDLPRQPEVPAPCNGGFFLQNQLAYPNNSFRTTDLAKWDAPQESCPLDYRPQPLNQTPIYVTINEAPTAPAPPDHLMSDFKSLARDIPRGSKATLEWEGTVSSPSCTRRERIQITLEGAAPIGQEIAQALNCVAGAASNSITNGLNNVVSWLRK